MMQIIGDSHGAHKLLWVQNTIKNESNGSNYYKVTLPKTIIQNFMFKDKIYFKEVVGNGLKLKLDEKGVFEKFELKPTDRRIIITSGHDSNLDNSYQKISGDEIATAAISDDNKYNLPIKLITKRCISNIAYIYNFYTNTLELQIL